MKLTNLAIEGYGVCRDLHLNGVNDGLNIVFGESGSGKTTVRNFIRGVLFGFESRREGMVSGHGPSFAAGSLSVSHNELDYRLARDIHIGGQFSIRPNDEKLSGLPPIQRVEQLTGNLSCELYDTVFNVSFHDTGGLAYNLARDLHVRMGVPLGKFAIQDDATFQEWKRQTDSIKNQLRALQQQVDALTLEKQGYLHQIDQAASIRNRELAAFKDQLNALSDRLKATETVSITTEISRTRTELAQIRDRIMNVDIPVVSTIPVIATESGNGTHATLYQRLDEIDNQIRRWRRVQTDIQNQRVRLRDEMLIWNDLTLESNEHPYHKARGILVTLESKVDRAEHLAKDWNNSLQRVHESSARDWVDLCQQMRDDIYGLCRELGHQYKHIRHKAAAAELKQLRRCYNEMGENTQRLIKRRDSVIDEIKQIDPVGAEAVIRSDHKFCECAHHEGYLVARRRFIGPLSEPLPVRADRPDVEVVHPDLTPYRARVELLENRLAEYHKELIRAEQMREDLNARQIDLNVKRERLISDEHSGEWRAKIENIDVELEQASNRRVELSHRLENTTYSETRPDPILDNAARLLSQMSQQALTSVWLNAPSGQLVVLDRFHNEVPFKDLNSGQQDQVVLSLCVAASNLLRRQGVRVPMLLDDLFAKIDPQLIDATFCVLRGHAEAGNQVIVFAKTDEFRLPLDASDVTVFEMPETNVSPLPVVSPDRQPFFPIRENAWETMIDDENQYFDAIRDSNLYNGNVQTRSYPLTKYPVAQSREAISPEMFERSEYTTASRTPIPNWDYAPEFTESSIIESDGIVDREPLGMLAQLKIRTVGDLLELNTTEFSPEHTNVGLTVRQIDRWQSKYWLLVCVPGLSLDEVNVLYALGIHEPEQLDAMHRRRIQELVQGFLLSPEGRRFNQITYSTSRLEQWYRALDSTRSRWQAYPDSSRRSRQSGGIAGPRLSQLDSDEEFREVPVQTESTNASNGERLPRISVGKRRTTRRSVRKQDYSTPTTPMVQSFTERQRSARPETMRNSVDEQETMRTQEQTRKGGVQKLKFYLDLKDDVEAAPSIGPRTAERFEMVGVITIADFLKQTAESMAKKIAYKRISADAIRSWQHQTRLVCRVPNLRGHDAQLLVACGITDPEDLATMDPKNLFDIIGPFSESKEGLKIIRSGKQPDLAEIEDWINWAGHTRSLQAA